MERDRSLEQINKKKLKASKVWLLEMFLLRELKGTRKSQHGRSAPLNNQLPDLDGIFENRKCQQDVCSFTLQLQLLVTAFLGKKEQCLCNGRCN